MPLLLCASPVFSEEATQFLIVKEKRIIFFSGAFDDEDVTHVEGEVNPVRDLEIIHEELRLKDEQYVTKQVVCH